LSCAPNPPSHQLPYDLCTTHVAVSYLYSTVPRPFHILIVPRFQSGIPLFPLPPHFSAKKQRSPHTHFFFPGRFRISIAFFFYNFSFFFPTVNFLIGLLCGRPWRWNPAALPYPAHGFLFFVSSGSPPCFFKKKTGPPDLPVPFSHSLRPRFSILLCPSWGIPHSGRTFPTSSFSKKLLPPRPARLPLFHRMWFFHPPRASLFFRAILGRACLELLHVFLTLPHPQSRAFWRTLL